MQQRLQSLDAYRGLIMVTLAFNGFGLAETARKHSETQVQPYLAASIAGTLSAPLGPAPLLAATVGLREKTAELRASVGPPFWEFVYAQTEHVEWAGCGYWDMIQPSFMFMVGAAMAFSYRKRRQQGESYLRLLGHALVRSLVLIFLGIFLISNNRPATDWSLMNVLSQIGLGYVFLFLLWNRPWPVQAFAAVAILAGTWLLYTSHTPRGIDLDTGLRLGFDSKTEGASVGITKDWADKYLRGLAPAWHKNANVGHDVDVWLLNRWPSHWQGESAEPPTFRFNNGGYQTLNFLPSLATMIFGLMSGELLRAERAPGSKLLLLLAVGLAGLALGTALHFEGVCPIVKRIWTPAWALFSTGLCCLILAGLYGVVDVLGYRRWCFPLVVVGMNSIAIYAMSQTLKPWASAAWRTHLGPDVFKICGPLYEPAVQATLVGLLFWLACYWMYRQKIFVRI